MLRGQVPAVRVRRAHTGGNAWRAWPLARRAVGLRARFPRALCPARGDAPPRARARVHLYLALPFPTIKGPWPGKAAARREKNRARSIRLAENAP